MSPGKAMVLAISLSSAAYLAGGTFLTAGTFRGISLVHGLVFLLVMRCAGVARVSGAVLPQFGPDPVLAGLVICGMGGAWGIVSGPYGLMGLACWGMGLTVAALPSSFWTRGVTDVGAEVPWTSIPGGREAAWDVLPETEVLAVTGNRAWANRAKACLGRSNISCTVVRDEGEALSLLAAGYLPGLLILDATKRTGYAACQNLRTVYASSELPILLLIRKLTPGQVARAYAAGASDCLVPAFLEAELAALARTHLDLGQAYQTVKENLRLAMEVRLQKKQHELACQAAEREGFEKLRYQINPHFLFNALASIRGALFSNPSAAHDMVSHLSEFCRLALSNGREEALTIEKEVETIRHYLAMEQMRFGDYLTVQVEMETEALGACIPAFILQPLVENAIKYGTRTSPDFLEVSLRVAWRQGILIEICNTGEWIGPSDALSGRSSGIGIRNIRARLQHFYGDRYEFTRACGQGRVSITLMLPDTLTFS